MSAFKVAFLVLSAAVLMVNAKPSHHLSLQAIPDHFDFAPPVLPAVPFHPEDEHAHAFEHGHAFDHAHAFDHGHFFDNGHVFDHAYGHAHGHILPPAPLFHEAPAAVFHGTPVALPCPAPVVPAHAHLLPAPAPLLPAPVPVAPLLPPPPAHVLRVAHVAPLLPAAAPLLPAPLPITRILPPVYDAIPFAPAYRAIPGPKTTTHHVSVGYAVPTLPLAHKLVAPHVPHAHFRVAPLSLPHHHHHHHHALF